MNTNRLSVATLELGVVTSSFLELNNNEKEHVGFSPYKAEIKKLGLTSILEQYKRYVNSILEIAKKTSIRTILSVGYEAKLIDFLAESCRKYELVILPNTQDVDFKRIEKNYPNNNIRVLSPFDAFEQYRSIKTLVIVPAFRLADDSWQIYSYPKFFLTEDLKSYCFMEIIVEMLPTIQEMDYRTSRMSPELRHFSETEYNFDKILTF